MDMDIEKLEKLTLQESIDFLNAFRGMGNCSGSGYNTDIWGAGNGNGNIYNITNNGGGAGAWYTAYFWLSSYVVNKWQRYLGRYLYISNAYATTAVDNLAIMALGSGLKFITDNKTKQKKLDEWVKTNKWVRKDIESFKRYLIDGEVFYRIFGEKVRFIDPDLIYGDTPDRTQFCGIVCDVDDQEEVEGYIVHRKPNLTGRGEFVEAAEIQHRANAHFGQRRGFSRLLNVASDLFGADKLTNNLIQTSDVLAKIAYWRIHQGNKQSVQAFRADVTNQPGNLGIVGQNGGPNAPVNNTIENYPTGSIIDLADTVDVRFPEALNGAQYNETLDATLRKVAAHFHLPTGVFNDRSERGAFASELVSNSYIVRSIEAIQREWSDWNLELLEMCGFDVSDIQVISPEVSIVDPAALIAESEFLIRNGLCSKATVAEKFGIDYGSEQQLIAVEPAVDAGDTAAADDAVDAESESNRSGATR